MNTGSALTQARGRRRARYIWSADLDELLIEAYTGKTERWRASWAIAKRTQEDLRNSLKAVLGTGSLAPRWRRRTQRRAKESCGAT
jgi:hypothetical protein